MGRSPLRAGRLSPFAWNGLSKFMPQATASREVNRKSGFAGLHRERSVGLPFQGPGSLRSGPWIMALKNVRS